jgi:dihydrofolate reductase
MMLKPRMGISADGEVYVLTSSSLPPRTPGHVTAGLKGPADLLGQLRSRPSGGDVHLVGGPRTIRAFHQLGALDRLELVALPVLLGEGLPLSPQRASPVPFTLLRADRTFPDGSAELVCTPK